MTSDLINRVFPSIIRFGSRPGGVIVALAAVADGFFLLFALLAAWSTGAAFAWFLVAVAAVLAVFVGLLAWRRARLTRRRLGEEGVTRCAVTAAVNRSR